MKWRFWRKKAHIGPVDPPDQVTWKICDNEDSSKPLRIRLMSGEVMVSGWCTFALSTEQADNGLRLSFACEGGQLYEEPDASDILPDNALEMWGSIQATSKVVEPDATNVAAVKNKLREWLRERFEQTAAGVQANEQFWLDVVQPMIPHSNQLRVLLATDTRWIGALLYFSNRTDLQGTTQLSIGGLGYDRARIEVYLRESGELTQLTQLARPLEEDPPHLPFDISTGQKPQFPQTATGVIPTRTWIEGRNPKEEWLLEFFRIGLAKHPKYADVTVFVTENHELVGTLPAKVLSPPLDRRHPLTASSSLMINRDSRLAAQIEALHRDSPLVRIVPLFAVLRALDDHGDNEIDASWRVLEELIERYKNSEWEEICAGMLGHGTKLETEDIPEDED